ncbi:phosphoinositide phospholipase C [Favolaschia claudopus]|uniref:Phosphoinositide phospholipase C n=1 Tax=Favolaschia claudopus TaxID=2862362 RepID=A0AAW0BVG3_9AGAR
MAAAAINSEPVLDATPTVPLLLQDGIELTKISEKSRKKLKFRIDPDDGKVLYPSRKHGVVPIESIKEIRTGSDAEYYCTQFAFPGDTVDKWITIVYVLHNTYRTLHLLAPTKEVKELWESSLRKLYSIRLGLMRDLDNHELRQTIWEKQYWKSADQNSDYTLSLDEVKVLSHRLNIDFPKGELERLFDKALNYQEFQRFVKVLKRRPELEALYKKLCGEATMDFSIFEKFMRDTQKSTLGAAELRTVFDKYASVESSPQPVTTSAATTTNSSSPPVPVSTAVSSDATPPPATTSAPVDGASTNISSQVLPPAPPVVAAASTIPPTTAVSTATLDAPSALNASSPVAPVKPIVPIATVPDALAVNNPSPVVPQTTGVQALSTTSPNAAAASSSSSSSSRAMTLDDFSSFLSSANNAPIHPESNDMSQPMSDYFISTSHNTYLVGNQLMGISTIEGYIRALLCGARSVELDVYDGPHEPMVYHGKTLTSAVSVKEICQAIAKYAFVSSPYPVMLSCEVHCGIVQQDMLVDIMTEAFGSALVRVPPEQHPAKLEALPSPEELRGRITVKASQTKNLFVAAELDAIKAHKNVAKAAAAKAAHLEAEVPSSESEESESEVQYVKQEIGQEIKSLKHKWHKLRGIPSPPPSGSSEPEPEKPKMSMSLASLLVYTVGVKCRGIDKSQAYGVEQIFSLSENSANKYIKAGNGIEDLIRHTQTHVVRIYPKGTRVKSTNYLPLQYWAAGCQLVALNVQTMDLGYRINQAMFLRRGRSGYVLKPRALRDPHFEQLRLHTKHYLDVTIISAQQLPRPKDRTNSSAEKSVMDPYIEVALHIPAWSNSPFLPANKEHVTSSDESADSGTSPRRVSFCTPTVKNNGFNPMWQEELCLPFDCVGGMTELIFVEFMVKVDKDEDAPPLASYIVPLSSLQLGFRHLPLHDAQLCQFMFSTLFVHINIRDVE